VTVALYANCVTPHASSSSRWPSSSSHATPPPPHDHLHLCLVLLQPPPPLLLRPRQLRHSIPTHRPSTTRGRGGTPTTSPSYRTTTHRWSPHHNPPTSSRPTARNHSTPPNPNLDCGAPVLICHRLTQPAHPSAPPPPPSTAVVLLSASPTPI
jgi:hypothetical protein